MSTLLLDYPGVLAHAPGPQAQALIEDTVGATSFWREYTELRPQLLIGAIDEKRFWNRLAARAQLPLFDVEDVIAADWSIQLDVDNCVVSLVDDLRNAGHTIGLIANVPTGLSLELRRRLPFLSGAVPAIFSCDIGLEVCDPRAFAVALEVLGTPAAKTTYFSRTPTCLAAARDQGLTTIDYHGPDDFKEFLA